jgi:hypothetical protein
MARDKNFGNLTLKDVVFKTGNFKMLLDLYDDILPEEYEDIKDHLLYFKDKLWETVMNYNIPYEYKKNENLGDTLRDYVATIAIEK